MSGHSHWHSIKHKKALVDSKKGKIFSLLSKMISVAAKEKGGDPDSNPRLRLAIEKAREANMPKDNIEKAIKKGTGELTGVSIEEFVYEAYGPGGVALIIEGITDNKNRTISEIKHILSKNESKIAAPGSVLYQFDKKENDWQPKYPIQISDEKTKKQLDNLFLALDEQEDISEIYSNLNN